MLGRIKNIFAFVFIVMTGCFFVINVTKAVTLMSDDFTGTTINTSTWTEYDPDAKVNQNEAAILSGSTGFTWFTRSLVSTSTFDRSVYDLTVEVDLTYSDCTSRGGIYFSSYTPNNLTADTVTFLRNASNWQLWKPFTQISGSTYACTNDVATHVKMVIKAVGGAEVYLNNSASPQMTLTAVQSPNTINNKNIILYQDGSPSTLTYDNLIIYDSRTVPSTTTGLAATSGDNQISLSWNEPDDGGPSITDYNIEYKISTDSSWALFADGISSSTSGIVTSLTNGISYDFRVSAINEIGTGATSTVVSSTPASIPSAPVSLTPEAGNALVNLSWSAPVDNGGSSITDYHIEYKIATDSTWALFADGVSNSVTTTVTSLTAGTEYNFRVYAQNSTGSSTASNIATSTPTSVPSQPSNLVATPGEGQIILSWDPSNGMGLSISDYSVEYKASTSSTWIIFSDAVTNSASSTINSLTNGISYNFRVSAINSVGTSTVSGTVTSTPISNTATAPQALSVSISGSATVSSTLTGSYTYLDANANAEGNTIFQWLRSDTSTGTFKSIYGASSSTYVLTYADINKYIKFEVTPFSAITPVQGTSQTSTATAMITFFSDNFTGTTIDTSKWTEVDPDAKVNQNDAAILSGSTGFTWFTRSLVSTSTYDRSVYDLSVEADFTYSDCAGRGGIYFSSYTPNDLSADTVSFLRNGGSWQLWKPFSQLSGSTYTCTNDVSTHIKMVIKAVGGAEVYLNYSATPQMTLTAVQSPNTINNKNFILYYDNTPSTLTYDNLIIYDSRTAPSSSVISSISPGGSQATLNWSAPSNVGSSAITDYIVEYKTTSSLSWSTFNDGTSTDTSATVTGLTNDIGYDFRIFAVNSVGVGYPSNSTTTIPNLSAPNPPTSLSATAGEGQVSLGWTASNGNGSAITDYFIEYKRGSNDYSVFSDGTSTATTTIITGLTNGLEYTFRIYSTNSVGTSSVSATVTSTPVLVAATAPTAINVTVTGTPTLYEALRGSYLYADPNADAEGATTFRWLRADSASGSYTSITDATTSLYILLPADLNKYIKFEVTPVSNISPLTGTPVLSSATGTIGAEMSYINHILVTGQSLAVGLGGSPVLSATQPYQNLKLDGSSLVPLVESSVETLASAMANTITNQVGANDYQVAVTNHGLSATAYAGLKKGTAPYQSGMDQVLNVKTAAQAIPKPSRVNGVVVVHGEGDAMSNLSAAYEGYLQQWQIDYENDVKAINGQAGTIPLFTDQMSSQTGWNFTTLYLPLGQLAAAENNPGKIILVGPKYQYPYVDFTHLTNQGYRMMGEYFGKVIKKVTVDRETWTPLSPLTISRSGNAIYAKFNVPSGPIVFDTTNVSARTNYGFEYFDDTSSATISSVEIFNSDTVKITLSGTPTGSGQQLRYAYTGVSGAQPGPQSAGSAAGNLRDSDATVSLYGNNLYNWSVHFAKDISADSTAPVVSSVTQTNSTSTAAFAWSTDEVGSTIIEYGVTSSYGYSTTEADVSTRVTSHSATLSNLIPCTRYYYRVKSKDFTQNQGVSTSSTFITDGCISDSSIIDQTGSSIVASTGGSLSFDYSDKTISLTIPANFSVSDAVFQIKQFLGTDIFASTSKPTSMVSVGSHVFDLKSFSTATTSLTSFDESITVTMEYTDEEISGLDETTLVIYRYDGSSWSQLNNCTINSTLNSISCLTTNFSIFALFGQTQQAVSSNGGGTMPAEAFLAPIPPFGGFKIELENSQLTTYKTDVILKFTAGKDVTGMAISNSANFSKSSLIKFKPTIEWNICQDSQNNCPAGEYKIFVKFYTKYGVSTKSLNLKLNYVSANTIKTAVCFEKINSNISFNAKNNKNDVINLQTFLKKHEGVELLKITGKFDIATKKAVINFQEKYAKEILIPSGLKKGTGNVFSSTLKRINSLACFKPKDTAQTECRKFTKNLKYGTSDLEVKYVKEFLHETGYFNGLVNNNFDKNLLLSVKKFQQKYADIILKPVSIKLPTGMWYASTRNQANKLLKCNK